MIRKSDIANALKRLDRKHSFAILSPDPSDAIDYSRLAVIIYCGWLEESLDKIARRSITARPTTTPFKDSAENTINRTYGFQYKDHFRKMMTPLIGIANMEKLEVRLAASNVLPTLISELESIKQHRNNAAHTFEGANPAYPTPNYLLNKVDVLYPIFKSIFSFIVHLK